MGMGANSDSLHSCVCFTSHSYKFPSLVGLYTLDLGDEASPKGLDFELGFGRVVSNPDSSSKGDKGDDEIPDHP